MHNSKICFRCCKNLSLSAFYKHKAMADGHLNKCKECCKSEAIKNRNNNIDYYLEYDKQRANIPKRVEARKFYSQTEAGKANARKSKTKWSDKNTIKRGASYIVNNAVRDGRLTKHYACEICNIKSTRLHGHHDDYAKPLEVRWLCSKCHCKWHKEYGEGLNG